MMAKQPPNQRSCPDVRMDPRYQKPPHYADIHQHRPVPQTPIEINEMGPTIQQGMIQCPVQRDRQAAGVRPRTSMPPMNTHQIASQHDLQIVENGGIRERDSLPGQEGVPNHNNYILSCIHKNRPFTLNDVGRPVFVNHYYAGEVFTPVTSKTLIKLDECDVVSENSLKNIQQQGAQRECTEHSQNLRIPQQQTEIGRGHGQRNVNNAALHSDLREHYQNSLKMTPVSERTNIIQKERNLNRGIHSEFMEHSQQSLGALNVGKSRVLATDQMNT